MTDPGSLESSLPPSPPSFVRPAWTRQEKARHLGERLVALQRRMHVLDAVRWDAGVEQAFFARGADDLPRVDAGWYRQRPLPFQPAEHRQRLSDLAGAVRRELGPRDPFAALLLGRIEEAQGVVELLAARGTPSFPRWSGRLFGQATPALVRTARRLPRLCPPGQEDEGADVDADGAACLLSDRLSAYFGGPVQVRLSAQLSADAAARGGSLKVRDDARFRPRDVRLLEVHEGWVHLGTTLNATDQVNCPFLARLTPAATTTQEGLAVLAELLTGTSHHARLRALGRRVEAIARAAEGADFLDVYRFFREEGAAQRDAYQGAARIFRGSLPTGAGPFTKDLTYVAGLVEMVALARSAPSSVALLFCGKGRRADVGPLAELVAGGLVAWPRFLPSVFADAEALREAAFPLAEGLHGKVARRCHSSIGPWNKEMSGQLS